MTASSIILPTTVAGDKILDFLGELGSSHVWRVDKYVDTWQGYVDGDPLLVS